MSASICAKCHGPTEAGYLTTTNGSGIFWSLTASERRLRPTGLEVLAPTGVSGTFSANLPGERCRACGTILLRVK
jgi:hypothetical protein